MLFVLMKTKSENAPRPASRCLIHVDISENVRSRQNFPSTSCWQQSMRRNLHRTGWWYFVWSNLFGLVRGKYSWNFEENHKSSFVTKISKFQQKILISTMFQFAFIIIYLAPTWYQQYFHNKDCFESCGINYSKFSMIDSKP